MTLDINTNEPEKKTKTAGVLTLSGFVVLGDCYLPI